MGILISIKDKILSSIGEKILNKNLKLYGELKYLKVDTNSKRVEIELNLKGEQEALKVIISKFAILESNNNTFIIIKELSTSKEWLTLVLNKYALDKKFEIPNKYSTIIKILF